ncbi:InlB B-repeat-containing protein [Halalkalibacter krulwichiae]|uniref:Bacterial repeat domain-containing protein n=1 Tax=Halalkalibacter krulwichiae TaxID=199441 RepID=A0A1X9MFJ1_9BACI|nr:tetratricopeptide repeat protein [Halalkalibacter krulwichiae]ARK32219.1 hypothetical protein BkAM31D_21500 [Halalkalibacter krulwichiae]
MPKKIVIPSLSIIILFFAGVLLLFPFESSGQIKQLEQKATTAFDQANFDESISYYEEILQVDPLHVNARLGLAKSYHSIAKLERAEMTLLEGIELLPDEARFYTHLSDLYVSQSDIVSTLSILKQGFEQTKSDDFQEKYETFLSQITIEIERPFIQVGHKRELKLVWSDEKERTLPIDAEWTVSDSDIANLDLQEKETWMLTGEAPGSMTVTAAAEDLTRKLEVEIKDQVVEEMEWLTAEEPTVMLNETLPITLQAFDANGEKMDIRPNWSVKGERGLLSESSHDNEILFLASEVGTETVEAEVDGLEISLEIEIVDENMLTTYVTGDGTVTAFPAKTHYTYGETIELQAVAAPGWTFKHWTGDLTGSVASQTITLEQPLSIGAVFERDLPSFTLQISKSGQGTIVQSTLDNPIQEGETVTVTARPDPGYVFERWTGTLSSSNASITFTMDQSISLQAVFKKQVTSSPQPAQQVEKPQPPQGKKESESETEQSKPVQKPTEPDEKEPDETPEQPETKPEPVPEPKPDPDEGSDESE